MKLRMFVGSLFRQMQKIGTIKIVAVAVTLMLVGYAPQMAQERPNPVATAQVQGPFQADLDRTVVLDDLPQITESEVAAFHPAPRPLTGFSEEQWKAMKARAAQSPPVTRPNGQALLVPSVAPQGTAGGGSETPGAFVTFTGQNMNCSGLAPSDMGLAVNPTFVVQVVNSCLAVYSKSGGIKAGYPKHLAAFFGQPPSARIFDPRATYDYDKGRWIIVVSQITATQGILRLAVSKTSDPTMGWNFYSFPLTGQFWDFPTLGQNWGEDSFNGGIFVCANIFDLAGTTFITAKCVFLPKAPIYAGGGFSYNFAVGFSLSGTLVDTIQPVNVSEKGEKPRSEFAINSLNFTFPDPKNGLVIWSFANTLVQSGSPGPTISGIFVATPSNYSLPANADQNGGANSIDTNDNRISGTVQYSAGHIFPTVNTANGGTSGIMGWEVQPFLDDNDGGICTGAFLDACPAITGATILEEWCYDCASAHEASAYFGTIQPLPENNWTMVFNYSTAVTYPSTVYTSNRVTWQKPFHDGGFFLQSGAAFYGFARWGDYTATAPDLGGTQPSVFFSGMSSNPSGGWRTAIGANKYVLVTQP